MLIKIGDIENIIQSELSGSGIHLSEGFTSVVFEEMKKLLIETGELQLPTFGTFRKQQREDQSCKINFTPSLNLRDWLAGKESVELSSVIPPASPIVEIDRPDVMPVDSIISTPLVSQVVDDTPDSELSVTPSSSTIIASIEQSANPIIEQQPTNPTERPARPVIRPARPIVQPARPMVRPAAPTISTPVEPVVLDVDTKASSSPTPISEEEKVIISKPQTRKLIIPAKPEGKKPVLSQVKSVDLNGTQKRKNKFIIYILFILVVFLVGMFVYKRYAPMTDTVKKGKANIQEVIPGKSSGISDSQTDQNYLAIEILTPDKTLLDLANKYYGNSCYWVYIYMENKALLKYPTNSQTDVKIKIPDLAYYGIQAGDSAAIQEALKLGIEILEGKRE